MGMLSTSAARGGYVSELTVALGQRQRSTGGQVERPFGERVASRVTTNRQYIDTPRPKYDYAAVYIQRAFAGVSTFMPLVFDYNNPTFINLAGYPGTVQGANSSGMWRSVGDVVHIADGVICHDADSSGGNSGGPTWVYSSLHRQAAGLWAYTAQAAPNATPRHI